MADAETFDCFLSHNARDKHAVLALAEELRAAGVSIWLDDEQLRPGLSWLPLLESGIRASRSVAVLIGADGLGPWEDVEMQAALTLAVRDKRPVIPVLLPDAPCIPQLPLLLASRGWVDLRPDTQPDPQTGLDRLIWGITGQRCDPSVSAGPRPTPADQRLPQRPARDLDSGSPGRVKGKDPKDIDHDPGHEPPQLPKVRTRDPTDGRLAESPMRAPGTAGPSDDQGPPKSPATASRAASAALTTWREKLNFLLNEGAIGVKQRCRLACRIAVTVIAIALGATIYFHQLSGVTPLTEGWAMLGHFENNTWRDLTFEFHADPKTPIPSTGIPSAVISDSPVAVRKESLKTGNRISPWCTLEQGRTVIIERIEPTQSDRFEVRFHFNKEECQQ